MKLPTPVASVVSAIAFASLVQAHPPASHPPPNNPLCVCQPAVCGNPTSLSSALADLSTAALPAATQSLARRKDLSSNPLCNCMPGVCSNPKALSSAMADLSSWADATATSSNAAATLGGSSSGYNDATGWNSLPTVSVSTSGSSYNEIPGPTSSSNPWKQSSSQPWNPSLTGTFSSGASSASFNFKPASSTKGSAIPAVYKSTPSTSATPSTTKPKPSVSTTSSTTKSTKSIKSTSSSSAISSTTKSKPSSSATPSTTKSTPLHTSSRSSPSPKATKMPDQWAKLIVVKTECRAELHNIQGFSGKSKKLGQFIQFGNGTELCVSNKEYEHSETRDGKFSLTYKPTDDHPAGYLSFEHQVRNTTFAGTLSQHFPVGLHPDCQVGVDGHSFFVPTKCAKGIDLKAWRKLFPKERINVI
ncbi:hypothetical protein NUU61_002157 [Penicillium alfredii]|uniref:Uncharacterized protein n=1 Tax=Penicillium alfredii TaxID=1506179 RepID=A0A9W9FRT8_9EURO|nr:uncharacterized protein NUU61_002157 [Penicillium alfredii]KAJ5104810.1 hypothetical protein NUU61_002157 [Penicillium alfredii]